MKKKLIALAVSVAALAVPAAVIATGNSTADAGKFKSVQTDGRFK